MVIQRLWPVLIPFSALVKLIRTYMLFWTSHWTPSLYPAHQMQGTSKQNWYCCLKVLKGAIRRKKIFLSPVLPLIPLPLKQYMQQTGLQKSCGVLQSWADPGSCSPRAYVMIFLTVAINAVSRVISVGEPENISMFSMFSKLTPCSPIRVCRI